MLGCPDYGTLDPDILIWCEENEFILVTNNRKSMPVHLQDHLAENRRATGYFCFKRKYERRRNARRTSSNCGGFGFGRI
jgi:hypothetical protein